LIVSNKAGGILQPETYYMRLRDQSSSNPVLATVLLERLIHRAARIYICKISLQYFNFGGLPTNRGIYPLPTASSSFYKFDYTNAGS
jgi:hypothetical protein